MSSPNLEKFHFNIRELRKQRGLNREQLAVKANVSYGYISALETKARTNPSLDTLWRLADVLEVSIDELIGREILRSKKKPS